MRFNNKGFTLVELLAAMVVLGLMMAVVIPNIVGILNNNKSTVYVEDVKKMVETLDSRRAAHVNELSEDTTILHNKQCIYYSLAYLDNSEFSDPPNGGCYDVNNSYVILCQEGNESDGYTDVHYVQLKEIKKSKVYGIPLMKYEDVKGASQVTKDSVKSKDDDFKSYYSNISYNSASSPLTGSDSSVTIPDSGSKKIFKQYFFNGQKRYKLESEADGICASK